MEYLYCKVSELNNDLKNDIITLWKETFSDDKVYIDFILNTFKNSYVFYALDGGILCAAAFFTDIKYKSRNSIYNSSYMYACAVSENHRKKGLFSALYAYAENILKDSGIDFIFCVPENESLVGFYEKFGFVSNVFFDRKTAGPADHGIVFTDFDDDYVKLYSIYLKATSDEESVFIKSKDIFVSSIEDTVALGFRIHYVSKDGTICGYIVAIDNFILSSCPPSEASNIAENYAFVIGSDVIYEVYDGTKNVFCMTKSLCGEDVTKSIVSMLFE